MRIIIASVFFGIAYVFLSIGSGFVKIASVTLKIKLYEKGNSKDVQYMEAKRKET
jgi:hypothetical protein